MKKEIRNHWQTWIFFLSLGIILIFVYKTIDSIGYLGKWFGNFISIIWPFLVGLLIAYLLYIPERRIEKRYKKSKLRILRKKSRFLAILSTYIVTLLLIILIIKVIIPVLSESINELIGNLQGYYSKIIIVYNELPDDSIFKSEQVFDLLKEMQNFDLKQYASMDKITGYLKSAVGIARGIFNVFVSIIVSVYILAERNEIIAFLKKIIKAIFKETAYENVEKYFYEGNRVFFKFISGQFIDAIIVGILATIALNIMRVKYASLLGFTIGLFNMIPYFGAIVAVIIAGIITLVTAGFSKAIVMLIVIVILQQIDSNIINPKIIGDSLKISPILVILSVTIGGAYLGIIGMFLAVPIAGVLKILVNDYIDSKLEK